MAYRFTAIDNEIWDTYCDHYRFPERAILVDKYEYELMLQARDEEDGAAWEAERMNERRLEDAGWYEAALQDKMEADRGVIPFDVAMRAA